MKMKIKIRGFLFYSLSIYISDRLYSQKTTIFQVACSGKKIKYYGLATIASLASLIDKLIRRLEL